MFSAVLQLMPSQSFLLGMSSLAVFYAPQARKRGRGKETDKGKICSPLLLLRFPSQTSLPTTPKTIAHVNNTVGRIFCLLFSPRPFKQILPPRPFTSIGKRKEERVSRRVGVVDRGQKSPLFILHPANRGARVKKLVAGSLSYPKYDWRRRRFFPPRGPAGLLPKYIADSRNPLEGGDFPVSRSYFSPPFKSGCYEGGSLFLPRGRMSDIWLKRRRRGERLAIFLSQPRETFIVRCLN